MGADITLNHKSRDAADGVIKPTGGKGAEASIEALGTQATLQSALRVLKSGGTLSSLDAHSSNLTISCSVLAAGPDGHGINVALCPGGKKRIRHLMSVVEVGRVDFGAMFTHRFKLDDYIAACQSISNQRDGVLNVAIESN